MIWPQCVLGTPWFQVSLRKCLVLRGIYQFPLPLDPNENWDSRYSHVNAQNEGEGVRGKGKGELGFTLLV